MEKTEFRKNKTEFGKNKADFIGPYFRMIVKDHISDSSNTELTWVKLQDILTAQLFSQSLTAMIVFACLLVLSQETWRRGSAIYEALFAIESWDFSCSFNHTQEAWGPPVPL